MGEKNNQRAWLKNAWKKARDYDERTYQSVVLPVWNWIIGLWRKIRGEKGDLEFVFLLLFVAIFLSFAGGLYWSVSTLFSTGVPENAFFKDFFKPRNIEQWDDLRSLTFAIAGVVGAVFGLYQLYNSATRTRLNRLDTQTKREQERNERYVSSVKLLSDDDPSVRMGGVFALERLALEKDADYTQTVLEVLSGFIRERTNRVSEAEGQRAYPAAPIGDKPVFGEDEGEIADINDYKDEMWDWLAKQKPPTEPIAAAVLSLGRIWQDEQSNPKAVPIKLEKAHLTNLIAPEIDLRRCILVMAMLEGADLRWARLEGANLRGAHFEGANLGWAYLDGADLRGAHLEDADLSAVCLDGAIVMATDLSSIKYWSKEQFEEQLDAAVWPTGLPPKLPEGFNAADFDKSAYTDPAGPKRLLPRARWPKKGER